MKSDNLFSNITYHVCLAPIEKCAYEAGILDYHLCLERELWVLPRSHDEPSECGRCFTNFLAYFCVQSEVSTDRRPEVREQFHNLQLVVASYDA